MVRMPRCYWPRRTDDSYQNIVGAGANGLGPSALPQPTTTLSSDSVRTILHHVAPIRQALLEHGFKPHLDREMRSILKGTPGAGVWLAPINFPSTSLQVTALIKAMRFPLGSRTCSSPGEQGL